VVAARRIAETLGPNDVMVVLLLTPESDTLQSSQRGVAEGTRLPGGTVAPLMAIPAGEGAEIPGSSRSTSRPRPGGGRHDAAIQRLPAPVLDTGILVGSLREENLMKALLENPKMYTDYVAKVMENRSRSSNLGPISSRSTSCSCGQSAVVVGRRTPRGIITRIDVIE